MVVGPASVKERVRRFTTEGGTTTVKGGLLSRGGKNLPFVASWGRGGEGEGSGLGLGASSWTIGGRTQGGVKNGGGGNPLVPKGCRATSPALERTVSPGPKNRNTVWRRNKKIQPASLEQGRKSRAGN